MLIKCFAELNDDERKMLYQYIIKFGTSFYFEDYDGMLDDYSGIIFDRGSGLFTAWEDGCVKGTIAVITKDVPLKGEAVITSINIAEQDRAILCTLLDRALLYALEYKPRCIKLGISQDRSYLLPTVRQYGFDEAYRAMVMRYDGTYVDAPDGIDMEFAVLADSNKKQFQHINNAAFLNSPNGSMLTDQEIESMVEEYSSKPGLAVIGYCSGEPAGMLELSVKEDTGWIEGLGVLPKYQGMGIGRALLREAVRILTQHKAACIRLFVLSSNTRAVNLYKLNGFQQEKVSSVWYERAAGENVL